MNIPINPRFAVEPLALAFQKGVSIQNLALAVNMPVCLCVSEWLYEVRHLYLVLSAPSTSYGCACPCVCLCMLVWVCECVLPSVITVQYRPCCHECYVSKTALWSFCWGYSTLENCPKTAETSTCVFSVCVCVHVCVCVAHPLSLPLNHSSGCWMSCLALICIQ